MHSTCCRVVNKNGSGTDFFRISYTFYHLDRKCPNWCILIANNRCLVFCSLYIIRTRDNKLLQYFIMIWLYFANTSSYYIQCSRRTVFPITYYNFFLQWYKNKVLKSFKYVIVYRLPTKSMEPLLMVAPCNDWFHTFGRQCTFKVQANFSRICRKNFMNMKRTLLCFVRYIFSTTHAALFFTNQMAKW